MTTIVAVIDRFVVFNIKNISTRIVSLLQKWYFQCNSRWWWLKCHRNGI